MSKNNSRKEKKKLKVINGGADMEAVMPGRLATMNSANVTKIFKQEDETLAFLKESGQKLNSMLNITDDDIKSSLKELRKECWK